MPVVNRVHYFSHRATSSSRRSTFITFNTRQLAAAEWLQTGISGWTLRGLFIVLEGIDGAGVSTQARIAAEWLERAGRVVVKTAEPTEGPIGSLIRQALRGEVKVGMRALALLFAADRVEHYYKLILPSLEAGRDVVCERYLLSSYAYQSLHVDINWIRAINSQVGRPDLTILLDIDPRIAIERKLRQQRGRLELFEKLDVLSQVRARYLELAREEGCIIVDSSPPIEAVSREIVKAIASIL
ncbi:MAG: dTMP kinase [Thermoproteota archaeon]|nr:MAG: dTMP kinase [Candidatus Korarchaeota archaeon]